MFNRIHRKLGTAGFIMSIVALVAALGGGAYAASGGLNGTQKKEVEKIAKKYAGKPGAPGANGAAGPAGTAGAKGDTGTAGSNGKDGTNGTNGTDGTDGKSVEAFPVDTGEPACQGNGGAVLEVEESGEPHEVCNGSPWTVGTLPPGATETGMWSFSAGGTGTKNEQLWPVSFMVPLAAGLDEAHVHFVGGFGEGVCTGSISNPTAPAGTLCVYKGELNGATFQGIQGPFAWNTTGQGTGKSGAYLYFTGVEPEGNGYGVWAVTAPTS